MPRDDDPLLRKRVSRIALWEFSRRREKFRKKFHGEALQNSSRATLPTASSASERHMNAINQPAKDSNPPEVYEVEVKTRLKPVPHLRGSEVQTFYQFDGRIISRGGVKFDTASDVLIPMRIVREKTATDLMKATPGARLRVEARRNTFLTSKFELHILRGEILQSATFVDGHKVKQDPLGEWRLFKSPQRTQACIPLAW